MDDTASVDRGDALRAIPHSFVGHGANRVAAAGKECAMDGNDDLPRKPRTPAERDRAMDELTRSIAAEEAAKLRKHREKTERLRQARLMQDSSEHVK
jgi:hypothetical protein